MSGLAVKSTGTCSDRTLPMRNPIWTPAMLPGHIDDWSSESGVTADGSFDVSAWAGRKGKVVSAAAGVRSNRSREMNGKTGLVFANDLGKTTAISSSALPYCVFAVWDQLTDPDGTEQVLFSCDAFTLYLNRPTVSNRLVMSGSGLGGNLEYTGSVIGRHIVVLYQPSAGVVNLRLDGAQVATRASGATAVTAGILALGRHLSESASTATLDAAIGALGIAGSYQALLDIQKLEGYLAQGWAGSTFLPVDHPYRSVTPRKLT